ncbi:MAG: hypothetical protein K0R26_2030 [Bacteroidota bacterium]|jgi:hypothetical protein|nr:hypothetical protein [Bacteroidota bacterium]
MKNIYSILCLFFIFLLPNFILAQEKTPLAPNEFLTMHYYTFQGTMDQSKIESFEQTLQAIQFVREAKVRYKPEKGMGQVVLVVREKSVTSEGDQIFSPTSIKQAMIRNGLTPMEYTTGLYEHK